MTNNQIVAIKRMLLFSTITLFSISAFLGIVFVLVSADSTAWKISGTVFVFALLSLFSMNNVFRLESERKSVKYLSVVALISNIFWSLPWILIIWNVFGLAMCTIPVSAFHVERDFAKALSEKIAIMPTDTEEDIANKQRVEELKAEIDGLTKQGVKMVDIIKTLQQESNLSAEARRQVQRDLNNLVKEGKIDEAGVFADKVNAEMKAENIEPVYVHPKLLEQGLQKEAENTAAGGVK
jgi:polyhydroxyalkanoate synthesis regulator phasin